MLRTYVSISLWSRLPASGWPSANTGSSVVRGTLFQQLRSTLNKSEDI